MIRFEKVTKTYDEKDVVLNQSFEVQDGEFFILVGPSGSGKTTVLKMMNRLVEQTCGEIYIQEKNIKDYSLRELRLNLGYVLQHIALFPNMTVGENIELIPELKKWKKELREERARELLSMVGLDPDSYYSRYPKELSGGEAQRVGILRAVISNPEIVLMDEPFSALDPISRASLQELVKELHQTLGMTIVMVTHDIDEALKLGDRICVMRNGSILQSDTPKNLLDYPADDFVKEYFNTESRRIHESTYGNACGA